jgi:hypothetical protein
MVAALALIFSIMTELTRGRARSRWSSGGKVGFMERPERIVLLDDRRDHEPDGRVLWVGAGSCRSWRSPTGSTSTYLALNRLPMPSREGIAGMFNRAFFWTDDRRHDALLHLGGGDPRLRLGWSRRHGSEIRWPSDAGLVAMAAPAG